MPKQRKNKTPIRPARSMPGWFRVNRDIFNKPYLKNEPFSEALALVWLLAEQAFTTRVVDTFNGPIELMPGELSFANEFLSTAWGWTSKR